MRTRNQYSVISDHQFDQVNWLKQRADALKARTMMAVVLITIACVTVLAACVGAMGV
jgi:hypothetical protein